MNIFEVRSQLNEIDNVLFSIGASLEREMLDNQLKAIEYCEKIIATFQKRFVFHAMQHGELSEEWKTQEWLFDMDKLARKTRYSLLNPLVALKIFGTRIKSLERRNNAIRNEFNKIKRQYMDLERKLKKSKHFKGKQEILDTIYDRKRILKQINDREDITLARFHECIMHLFLGDQTISRQDFLSLISVEHERVSWDDVQLPTYPERIKNLPEHLDYEAFIEAVFMDKVEDFNHCPFFDTVMDYTLEMIEKNKEFKEMSNRMVREIFGPIPTYTATLDEFGDIVDITPNKPDLHVIQ
jgi:hypothetical protein